MQKWDLFGYEVEIDAEKTKKWYDAGNGGVLCDCAYCRNFLKVVEQGLLPAPITDVLKQLGISPEDSDEVLNLFVTDNQGYYEICYPLMGQVFNPTERKESEDGPVMIKSKEFPWGEVCCSSSCHYAGDYYLPDQHFRMIFTLMLPWVLDEPIG